MNMKKLLEETKTSVLTTLVLLVLFCGIYPVLVWGLSQAAFPRQANGSLIVRDGRVVGSRLIGQDFKSDRYFHPRPSAAGQDGYDAANSGGSNLGPLSRKLMDQVKERAEVYRTENGLPPEAMVPADAVTASASGLDPHISVKNAELQAGRVARARAVPEDVVKDMIRKHTEFPQLGFLGDPAVNVLELNLALDSRKEGTDGGRQGS